MRVRVRVRLRMRVRVRGKVRVRDGCGARACNQNLQGLHHTAGEEGPRCSASLRIGDLTTADVMHGAWCGGL